MEHIGLHDYYWLSVLLAAIIAFGITYRGIPSIVDVSKIKRLVDEPNHRKSHTRGIPNLGGIAIFAGVVISQCIFINFEACNDLKYIISAVIIVFFVGMKDDVLSISPRNKLIGEISAALIIAVLGNIRLTSLHGFLGVQEIPYIASIVITVFVIIVVLNSVNLIDGIDGLAAGVSILVSLVFGGWFFLAGVYDYAIISAAIIGGTSAFFLFNVFGKRHKIFMGDTGSLILGLYLAVLAIKFNEANISASWPIKIFASPAVSIGILVVPLFDTLRVFILRTASGKSPFIADKNHVHHSLIGLGLSHLSATLWILAANIIFIVLSFLLRNKGIINVTLFLLLLAILFTYLPTHLLKRRGIELKDNGNGNGDGNGNGSIEGHH